MDTSTHTSQQAHKTKAAAPAGLATSPSNELNGCRLVTIWNYRYPRLLGRIWFEERFRQGKYEETRADLDRNGLESWLRDAPPGTWPFPDPQALRITAEDATELSGGFVLAMHDDLTFHLELPVPEAPDDSAFIWHLAEHASDDSPCHDVSHKPPLIWLQDRWPAQSPFGSAAETATLRAEARRAEGGVRWAISSLTLVKLEKAIREAIELTWRGNGKPYGELVNAQIDEPGFKVRVDPDYTLPRDPHLRPWHYPNLYVFEEEGVRVPPCPPLGGTWDLKGLEHMSKEEIRDEMVERLQDRRFTLMDPCPIIPCCP
jgi:hypothetical protein